MAAVTRNGSVRYRRPVTSHAEYRDGHIDVNGTADVGLRASAMGAVESVTRLRVAASCREVALGVGR